MAQSAQQESFKQVDKYIVTNQQLGKGSFGQVFRGFFKDNHSHLVAVKVISLDRISQDVKYLELLKREIDIMQKIEHPNIVRMYGASRTARNLYMFLEYCRDGDLKLLLKKKGGRLAEDEAIQYFKQICEGFKVLQQNSIIHRDVKPANILLHDGIAKLTDFGFARIIDVGNETEYDFSKVGTPLYMSPQILNDQKFSSKCDIWSLGMVFYEMLYGKTPWTANNPFQLYQNIKSQPLVFDKIPPRSDKVKNLLREMLIIEDKDRISWEKLFQNELLKEVELDKEIKKVESEQTDDLMKSMVRNKLYMQNNKVMGVNKQKIQQSQQQKVQQKATENSPAELGGGKEFTGDIDKALKTQELDAQNRKVIESIDSYFSYERNIAIFINYSSTQFFNFYNNVTKNNPKKLNLTEDLFYKIFFLFQKYQIIIFNRIVRLMNEQADKMFDLANWAIYLKSKEYNETKQAILQDKEFMVPYFTEVLKRTKALANQPAMKNIQAIINVDFSENDQFKQLYNETMMQLIVLLKPFVEQKSWMERDFLLALRYTFICLEPYKCFKWSDNKEQCTDFHKFYETYETLDEEAIYNEIVALFKSKPGK